MASNRVGILMPFDITTRIAIAQNIFMDKHGTAPPHIVIMHPSNYIEPFTLLTHFDFVLAEGVDVDKYFLLGSKVRPNA